MGWKPLEGKTASKGVSCLKLDLSSPTTTVLCWKRTGNCLNPNMRLSGLRQTARIIGHRAFNLAPDVILLDIWMPTQRPRCGSTAQSRRSPCETDLCHHDERTVLHLASLCDGGICLCIKAVGLHRATQRLVRSTEEPALCFPQLSLEVQDAIETPSVEPEGFSSKLTPRQQEVLQLLTKGLSTKEIADSMQVSTKAVEFHKGNITRRLGIRTTAELTRFALSQGLTRLDEHHP